MIKLARIAIAVLTFTACNESTKTNESSSQESEPKTNSEDLIIYGEAFFTAYDGVNDFSLLLLGEREIWKIKDSSKNTGKATIEEIEVNLSDTNFDSLAKTTYDDILPRMEQRCEGDSEKPGCPFTFETFKERFTKNFTVQKITPLSTGIIELVSEGRGPRHGHSRTKYLSISGKDATSFEAGKQRYSATGTGSLQSCESCHLSGENNAPPHALGRVKDFSDEAILSWIETGSAEGISSSISHNWEFNNDQERTGIVPYLRSLQAKDLNSLVEQYVAEIAGDFEDGIGGSD